MPPAGTPRLSTTQIEFRSSGFGSAFLNPSPPARPVSAGAPAVRPDVTLLDSKKTGVRPASARPRTTRPLSGKGKKPDAANAGKAELAKRKELPDWHPDKV